MWVKYKTAQIKGARKRYITTGLTNMKYSVLPVFPIAEDVLQIASFSGKTELDVYLRK